jgi:hypothetical protein
MPCNRWLQEKKNRRRDERMECRVCHDLKDAAFQASVWVFSTEAKPIAMYSQQKRRFEAKRPPKVKGKHVNANIHIQ